MTPQSPVMTNSTRRIPFSRFDQYESLKRNPYTEKVSQMPGWLAADKIIPALLGVLIALVSIVYFGLKSDIDDLKKDVKEIVKQSAETRVDLVRAIGAVEKQGASTNARLDQLIADGRQRH
jgi:hypothetical protein